MSQPNDPYAQGNQPRWPGEPGSPGPYRPDPYHPGPYGRRDPHGGGRYAPGQGDPYGGNHGGGQYGGPQGQPDPYARPDPYGQQTPTGGWPRPDPTRPYTGQYGSQHPGQYGSPHGGGPPTPPGTPYPGVYGPLPSQPEPPKRTGLVIGSLVAVIALVAAGVATYLFAFAGSAGASTPKEAAVNLVDALSKNDVVGLLDGLAPAEGAVVKDYLGESLDELKRLGVIKPEARPEQITGIAFKAEELVFDDAAEEKLNDHLAITKLIDGKITLSSDWSKVPLTEKFLKRAFPDGVPRNESQTIDVGDEIAKSNDGKPVRIATVKVDGDWYPSLFYSIADAALQDEGKRWPAQAIAARGADSPEAAVQQLLEAALRGDAKRAIELTPPDEAAALHDVGQLVVEAAKDGQRSDGTLKELKTRVEDVAGGKRVSLSKLTMENGEGETFSIEVDGDCAKVDDNGDRQELCGKDLAQMIADFAEPNGRRLTDDQLGAIERATVGYLHSGLITTKVGGKWYVSPARSLGDFSTGFLRKLRPGDLETLIEMVR